MASTQMLNTKNIFCILAVDSLSRKIYYDKHIAHNKTLHQDTHLHPDNRIDEEEHGNQQANIRQRLEWLHERPKQNTNGVALAQQLDESGGAEQPQEANVKRVGLLCEMKGSIRFIIYRGNRNCTQAIIDNIIIQREYKSYIENFEHKEWKLV